MIATDHAIVLSLKFEEISRVLKIKFLVVFTNAY